MSWRPGRDPAPDHPANYVLMMFIGMNDPGLARSAHASLVPGLAGDVGRRADPAAGRFLHHADRWRGGDLATTVWDEIETGGDQGTLGLFTQQDERWVVASITPAGRARMAKLARRAQRGLAGAGREHPAPAADRHTFWKPEICPSRVMFIWWTKSLPAPSRASFRSRPW